MKNAKRVIIPVVIVLVVVFVVLGRKKTVSYTHLTLPTIA